jgi:hypothetical protein
LHDLPRTAAIMPRREAPLQVVSVMVGYSLVAITLDIYNHVLPNM